MLIEINDKYCCRNDDFFPHIFKNKKRAMTPSLSYTLKFTHTHTYT